MNKHKDKLVCPSCGQPTSPSAMHCLRCGAKLPANTGSTSEEATTSESEQAAFSAGIIAPTIYLRIVGTPYAYQSLPGARSITLGRQRRKPGELATEGNDIVLRVEGRDEASLRISRRHLEIARIGQLYYVISYGRSGTKINRSDVLPSKPTLIQPGDQLLIAGVITIEFLVRSNCLPNSRSISQVDLPFGLNRQAVMHATIGDLLTVDP